MFDSDHLEAFKDGMHKELLDSMLNKEGGKYKTKIDVDMEQKKEYDDYDEEMEENIPTRHMGEESSLMKDEEKSRGKGPTDDGSKMNTTNDEGAKMNKI